MKIGIDISQIVYEGTGVGKYTKQLIEGLLKVDRENEYILFFSSLRRQLDSSFINEFTSSRVKIRRFRIPPTLLDVLWDKLHIAPIEWFIGEVDVFFSSDWTQPPTVKAKKATTIHDLSIFKFPEEHHPKIVAVQKRRLKWVKRECDLIICDSLATKKDAMEILGIEEKRLKVVYPGASQGKKLSFKEFSKLSFEELASVNQKKLC